MTTSSTYCADKGLRKVGDETSMVPDFPTGLLKMYEDIPKETGLAFYTVRMFYVNPISFRSKRRAADAREET